MNTKEILASRALCMSVHQGWVDWAEERLVRGLDSPTLRIMAGEREPFDTFEITSMLDRVIHELGLAPYERESDALVALLECRLQQMLGGR